MNKYNIQLTSKLTGVSIHTLRAWEKRYQVVTPERTSTNRRLYSDGDVEKLSLLFDLCQLGHNISEIAGENASRLKEMLEGYQGKSRPQDKRDEVLVTGDTSSSVSGLILALEFYKLDVIGHELSKLKIVMGPRKLVFEIVTPLLAEVGKRIAEKKLTQAHFLAISSILRFHLGHILFKGVEVKRKSPEKVVLIMPEGEIDEIILYLAGILCSHYQKNFFYAGANVPTSSASEICLATDATHIVIGRSVQNLDHRKDFIVTYMNRLDKKLGPNVKKIILGQFKYAEKLNFQAHHCTFLKEFDRYLADL